MPAYALSLTENGVCGNIGELADNVTPRGV